MFTMSFSNENFLPKLQYYSYKILYIYCRVLVQHIDSLASQKTSVNWHITSQYTCEMAKKSTVVSVSTDILYLMKINAGSIGCSIS